ncbi:MAG: clostripain-related cysteine peptidase [Fimbriimonas sp.]|nr:clostripain-related cysteine peptidase [Fimbriimonas sp.]
MKPLVALRNLLIGLALVALSGCGGGGGGTPTPPTHGAWTLMVFLNAANDLDAYSTLNVLQMQQAATNPDVRIVVQWKQSKKVSVNATFNGTRRYLIKQSNGPNVVSQLVENMGTGVDMGVPQTVNRFVAWSKARYPADHYALVMWDHGSGWQRMAIKARQKPKPLAVSLDSETGHSIETWQLNQALQNEHVDILAFDASLMQMAEVAYQLVGSADYVAGSEESPPGDGYPYQNAFATFANNPTGTPASLSKAFVDAMTQYPQYATDKIEESVIDTSQMAGVASAASALSAAMIANAGAIDGIIPQARSNTQAYLPSSTQYYYDVVDLCHQISALTANAPVQTACANLATAVGTAVIWEGHNSHSAGSHGLSIDFSPSSYFKGVSSDYTQLAWSTPSAWGQWLAVAP